MGGIGDLLMVIGVLGVVFFLAWYVTRFVGLRAKGRASGRFMRVVDRLNISNDKAILIVKIGREYSVIGVTGHQMSLLGKLDDDQAEAFAQDTGADAWKGMSLGARLGFAMRKSAAPPPQPKPAQPKPAQPNTAQPNAAPPRPPQPRQEDDKSALDRMDERIKLRKETKRW